MRSENSLTKPILKLYTENTKLSASSVAGVGLSRFSTLSSYSTIAWRTAGSCTIYARFSPYMKMGPLLKTLRSIAVNMILQATIPCNSCNFPSQLLIRSKLPSIQPMKIRMKRLRRAIMNSQPLKSLNISLMLAISINCTMTILAITCVFRTKIIAPLFKIQIHSIKKKSII